MGCWGDSFDPLEGAGLLEIADLTLDEPDLESEVVMGGSDDDDGDDDGHVA